MDSLIRNIRNVQTSIVNICVQVKIEVEYDPLYLVYNIFKLDDLATLCHRKMGKLAVSHKTTRDKIKSVIECAKHNVANGTRDKVYFPYVNRDLYHKNAQGYFQSQFIAIRQSTYYPKGTSLIFTNGIVMCVGIKNNIKLSIENTLQKISNVLQTSILIKDISIVNIVVSFRLPFSLDFMKLKKFLDAHNISYTNNNNTFSGFFIKILIPIQPLSGQTYYDFYQKRLPVNHEHYRVITLLLFENGVCSLLGNQSYQDWQIQPDILMGLFINFSHGRNAISESEVEHIISYFNFKPLDWYCKINFFFKASQRQENCEEDLPNTRFDDSILFMRQYNEENIFSEHDEQADLSKPLNLIKDGSMKIIKDKDKIIMISNDFVKRIGANFAGNPERHCGSYRARYKELNDRRVFSNRHDIKNICNIVNMKTAKNSNKLSHYCCNCT